MNTLNIVILVAVICAPKVGSKQCEEWFLSCMKTHEKDPYFLQYKPEYKKAHLFILCGLKGGYLR